jgi:hypothetical protein
MKQQKNWSEMTPKEKVFGCSNLLLFLIFFSVIVIWGASKCSSSKDSEQRHHDIVYNEGTTGSVEQVESYLKSNLNDPKSYQPVEWSNVVKKGNLYCVRHKYRAKNGFGALMLYNQVFTMDSVGTVINVYDYRK